jgi:hypothetical protein
MREVASIVLLPLVVGLTLSTPALGTLVTSHIETDEELLSILPEESVAFVAEGRIGDLGGAATFELDLGQSTGAPDTSCQYPWQSGVDEDLMLVYDAGTGIVTFSLGGRTLSYSPDREFTEVFVRTRAVDDDTQVTVFDMILDGEAVGDLSAASGPDGRDILRIQGGNLTDGFVLTGSARLTWFGDPPSQSRLAFQIKVGTPEPPVAIRSETWGSLKGRFR